MSARATVLVNYAGYQIGWLAVLLGAGAGYDVQGTALAVALTAGHLWLADDRRTEVWLLLAALVTGGLVESWQIASGTYRLLAGVPAAGLPPWWLLTLWGQFATTFRFSLAQVMTRPVRAAVLGALGGPLAFLAGERLGAVALTVPLLPGLLRLAVAWAAALLWLAWLTRRMAGPLPAGYRPRSGRA